MKTRDRRGETMCDGVRTELITFITENQEKLYRFAVSQMKDRDAALDTLQNAIVKALENYKAIRKPEYMKTWFYRILLNECHGYMRKNSREIAFEPEQVYRMQEGEMQLEQTDFELYRQIQGLPDKLRTVIILRFYEDFSLEEIARATRAAWELSNTALYSGLRRLEKKLKEESR